MAFTPFVETDQPTMANFNAKFQEAMQAVKDETMQMVSYVGTGTYGSGNPCSITANFPIKSATFLGVDSSGSGFGTVFSGIHSVVPETLSDSYTKGYGFCFGDDNNSYCKISQDKNTISWYNTQSNPSYQLNSTGATYYFLCRG